MKRKREEMTRLTEILQHKGHLLTTEFLSPREPRLGDLVNKALRVAGLVDSINLPELKANVDSRPKFRMNPFYAAMRVRDLTGVETLFHMTPRDYNRNAIAGLLLSAAEANMDNILVVGGDRYDRNETTTLSKNVYDYNGTTSFIRGIRTLESDAGLGTSRFCVAVGTDPTVIYTDDKKRIEDEVAKLAERQDAGADIAQTQPVFDMRFLEFQDYTKAQGVKIPIVVGILPLRSKVDSAEIERRYGISIPTDLKLSLGHDGEKQGRILARELTVKLLQNGVRHIHLYPRENCDFVIDVAKTVSLIGQSQ